jgi:hypothetical protein
VLFGPTAVFLTTPGHWVIGVLVNNQWSVGGDPLRSAVYTFLAQPFVNYNMAHGWYLTTSPIITSNWLAAPGQQWTVVTLRLHLGTSRTSFRSRLEEGPCAAPLVPKIQAPVLDDGVGPTSTTGGSRS